MKQVALMEDPTSAIIAKRDLPLSPYLYFPLLPIST